MASLSEHSLSEHSLPLLMSAQDLHRILDRPQLLLIDLCRTEQYHHAHIPGAIHVPFMRLLSGSPPAAGALPPPETIENLMCEIGLTHDHHVVAYDDEGGGWAGRFLWTLDVIGHKKQSYLDGGLHAWLAEGYQLESAQSSPHPSNYTITADHSPIADKAHILSTLHDPNVTLWDARTPHEYLGLQPTALQNGHIPGAINYEWLRAIDTHNHFTLRDLDTIKDELNQLGISPDKNIITYCHAHHRSGFTYMLAKILEFQNIQAYPGAWSEWGNDPATPIETQPTTHHHE